ncbi:MAG: ATP phosphoribosyltransferase [Acidimicrobiia bacterium]|nr:ATP phosphoribosyltransferase [Acidimicrobiia bacterium]
MTFSLAVPNKGRLKEPSMRLLTDAGLRFETTDRALSVPVRNVDMELLFVRTDDIAELVSDEVADAGITGVDLIAEHGNGLQTLVELGYGHCRLAAAVPNHSPIEKVDEFGGLRVATAHPKATGRFFADRNIEVDIIELRGSVEVATKIGVADAIVDLISTGSTMRVNGLRPVGTLIESQAVLISRSENQASPEVQQVATAIRAVVAGRNKRYLLLNAPRVSLDTITELIPGLNSPTVVPLAHSDMVAIHSVVDAADMWSLLPKLEQAGASGILVLPIEQLVP